MTSSMSEANRTGARARALLRTVLLGVSTLAVTLTLFSGPASPPAAADPPLSVAEAKVQVAQLETDAAALDQEYVGVKERLDESQKKLAAKQAAVKKQTAIVNRMRVQVGQVALAHFQNRSLDTTAQLFFTEDTDGFLNQISTVEKVSENQNTVLQDFQAEQANLAVLERSTKTDLLALQEQGKRLAELRKASEKKIADSKAVLARLTEEERRRIAAEERAAAEAARLAAESAREKAEAASSPGAKSGRKRGSGISTGSGSSKGAVALAFARAQIGKPYRFAASGPEAYDCSGLTSAAWRSAGVSLPRTSQAQFQVGRAVSRADLQLGDLVFFYSDLSHVGLYAGNGMLLNSSRPGKPVGYIQMAYMPFAGARRPG